MQATPSSSSTPASHSGSTLTVNRGVAARSSSEAVDLVLVGYRALDITRALAFCKSALTGRPVRRRVLVLNDPSLQNVLRPGPAWEVLIGTNRLGEFSGWQEALSLLDDRSAGVIFVNDTVCTHRRFSLARKLGFARSVRAAQEASLVGFRDQGQGLLSLGGLPLQAWTSSYCFMLDTTALERLERRLYDPEFVADCVPGGLDEDSFFSNLSADLDAHLRRWLFEGGWYAGEPLSEKNSARLRFKAQCIVAEKALSGRCDKLGIRPVDPFDAYPILRWLDKVDRKVWRQLRT